MTVRGYILCSIFAHTVATQQSFQKIPYTGSLPIPTPQQLQYQGSISGLIHFGMATFAHDGDPGCDSGNWNGCDSGNGGCYTSNVSTFNPVDFDVSNWIESFKALGAKSAVLTAKHGCGFLGWKTKTELPDGTPYRYHVPDAYPVVEQFVEKMTAANLGFGFYYSLTNNFFLNEFGHVVRPPNTLLPNQANVTQQQYEDIAVAQVKELWSIAPMTELWLDGGVGDLGDRIASLINVTYAKDAVAFNGGGVSANPVRWCGRESGMPQGYPTVWSTSCCGWCPDGSGSGCSPNSTGAMYQPSGVDVTLQLGDHWFFTPGDSIHPLSDLIDFYHWSVGANAHLEIDFAIDRTGRVDPVHAQAYASFGNWIRSCYSTPAVTASLPKGATSFVIPVTGSEPLDRVSLQEDQTLGQMIYSYTVEAQVNGAWQSFSSGVTIGSNRIDIGSAAITPTAFRFTVTSGFEVPTALVFNAFAASTCNPAPFEYATH